MLLEAIVRRFTASLSHSEATTGARLTTKLSVAVAQVESEYAELTRSGRMFTGLGVAAGAAPVQAIPTTTATHFLYNPDPRKSYVLVDLGVMVLSGTPAQGVSLWGIVTPLTATLPGAATGSLVGSWSAGGLSSKAIFATAYTIPTPAGNSQWGVIPGQGGQPTFGTPAVAVGQLIQADIRGRIIIPPGKGLGLVVFAGAGTTPLYVPHATWYESEEDME